MDGISDERQGESRHSPLFDENKGGEKVLCMSMLYVLCAICAYICAALCDDAYAQDWMDFNDNTCEKHPVIVIQHLASRHQISTTGTCEQEKVTHRGRKSKMRYSH